MQHILNEIFDKIYVINIDSATAKMDKIKTELSGINYERFSAITPNSADFEQNQASYITDIELAITLSHIKILKTAKKLNLKNVLIFEDDIIADTNFLDFQYEFMENFLNDNDWALFYLGGIHLKSPNYLQKGVFSNVSLLATHAYAINGKYFDIIINHLEKAKFKIPIDINYACYLSNVLPSFASRPRLYLQQHEHINIEAYKDIPLGDDKLKTYLMVTSFNNCKYADFIPKEIL